MRRFSRWLGVAAALGISGALVPVVGGQLVLEAPPPVASGEPAPVVALAKKAPQVDLGGLDLLKAEVRGERVIAPLPDARQAELTLDPNLQRTAKAQLKRYRVPEGGIVVLEVATGRVLAWASQVLEGEQFDVNLRAQAPAASIFKVVTGAALIDQAGLRDGTAQCYRGGRSRVTKDELIADARKDKWCATLGEAMGRSLNVVFARLAAQHLSPEKLTAMGGALGFGAPVPFVVPNDAPKIELPSDPTEFARSAAGFWHTTLSPLAAASMAQTIANGGVTLEPRVVEKVTRGTERLWSAPDSPRTVRRAMSEATAAELTTMMLHTVDGGSARAAFRDGRGKPFLPGVAVAGKTGTLTAHDANRHYTWFVGFAPAKAPEVAIATLVVNRPDWQIKAPRLAANVLRSWAADARKPGVTPP